MAALCMFVGLFRVHVTKRARAQLGDRTDGDRWTVSSVWLSGYAEYFRSNAIRRLLIS
jgi:hypothetical protein